MIPPRNHSLVLIMGSIAQTIRTIEKETQHTLIPLHQKYQLQEIYYHQSCQVSFQQLSILSNLAIYSQLKCQSHHLEISNIFVNNTMDSPIPVNGENPVILCLAI